MITTSLLQKAPKMLVHLVAATMLEELVVIVVRVVCVLETVVSHGREKAAVLVSVILPKPVRLVKLVRLVNKKDWRNRLHGCWWT